MKAGGKTLMNAARTNMFYFSLYYRENTGCLHCDS